MVLGEGVPGAVEAKKEPPTEATLLRLVGLHGLLNFVGESSEVLM